MFARMRQNEKLLLVVLVGISLPAFGLPAASFLTGFGGGKTALTWKGGELDTGEYTAWGRRWLGPRTRSQAGDYGAKEFHAHIVLTKEAERIGIRVTDDEVQDFIVACATTPIWNFSSPIHDPLFADRNGFYFEFFRTVFQRLAEASNTPLDRNTQSVPWDGDVFNDLAGRAWPDLPLTEFREGVREDLMVTKLRKLFDMANYESTEAAYKRLSTDRKEIAIEYAYAHAKDYDAEVAKTTPTDDELQAHYEKFVKKFELPETRTVELLVCEIAEIEKVVEVTETEAKKRYDETRDDWRRSNDAKTDAEIAAEKDGGGEDEGKKDDEGEEEDGDGLQDPAPAPAPAPAEEPAPAEPAQDPEPGDGEPGDGEAADGEPEEPVDEDLLPYDAVQQQIKDAVRRQKAIDAADACMNEVRRIVKGIELDEEAAERDPMLAFDSLKRVLRMINKRSSRFLPGAGAYRPAFRKVETFRSAEELRQNDEDPGEDIVPIADFLLADGTTLAREVADLYGDTLPMGRISPVLRTGTARALARFLDREDVRSPAFTDIKDGAVKDDLLKQRALDAAKKAVEACAQEVAGGARLMVTAQKHDLNYLSSGYYMKGMEVPGFLQAPDQLAQSPFFDLPIGQVGQVAVDVLDRVVAVGVITDRREPAPHDIPADGWDTTLPSLAGEQRSVRDKRFSEVDTIIAEYGVTDNAGIYR